MSDLDPAELSAFLDGELDPVRARQIAALIAADPGVSAAFDQIKQADQHLRSIARAAVFPPAVRWSAPVARPAGAWLILPLIFILLAWVVGKLAPAMTMALLINAASLLLFVACLVPVALRETRAAPGAP